jgi:hypothetical protein
MNNLYKTEFEKNFLPSNFDFLEEAITFWEDHKLVIR